jgi:DNA polymerase-3 subunit gamma/tau
MAASSPSAALPVVGASGMSAPAVGASEVEAVAPPASALSSAREMRSPQSALAVPQVQVKAEIVAEISGPPQPRNFEEALALFAERGEMVLYTHLFNDVHLVHFEPGRIEFRPTPQAPPKLASDLSRLLGEWTETRWVVSVSGAPGAPTLREQAAAAETHRRDQAAEHPLVKAVLAAFPGARIRDIQTAEPPPPEPEELPEDPYAALGGAELAGEDLTGTPGLFDYDDEDGLELP